ncbi:MAG: PAS domain-containing sensor histidine kinase [Chloroflexi bacterium]|nr:PAS domain-containing sensor histidine kinase [Chloroflexota bacterium]MXX83256.1 PAS domain-containing sensor histidine kinase [Chloroflexota bacterium]MYA94501.1 PAS domain-containing sensor histidine kinase [Chloroflexota bacterium]MYC55685.1 PAS domain-containing sensor histidine kinase [Chloroflexota bacterium]MYD37830.1 PAS domain-containing sensor histidine kinase [Chloroflexota bacterium]
MMSHMPRETRSEADAGLGGLHRFGSASESLFRRLYLRLSRQRAARPASPQARQQQRQSSQLDRLRAIFASLEEGIIMQDTSGKVTMMNRTGEAMLGGKRNFWGSALGTLFEQYRHVQTTSAELVPLGEAAELPLNNRIVRAQLSAIGDEDNRRIGTVIILRDVTHDALALRLKDGFVAHIARELSNPVTVIKLAGELLSAQPEDAAVNQRLLDKLLRNVDMLDQLALELLDIAQLKAGSLDVARQSLRVEAVIWSVVNGMEAALASRGIDLLVMTRGISAAQVLGDDKRLQWALGHLVRNGADYAREDGYVAVAARGQLRGGKRYVLVTVSDNGIGIKPVDMPHIFERFYRGDASAAVQAPRGLGQGLYVARAIAEAHGGFLTAESREGVGSMFTLGIPQISASA